MSDHEDYHRVEVLNLISEIRSDLEKLLHLDGLPRPARDIAALVADKLDGLADLSRG